jgi:hypothetical protein
MMIPPTSFKSVLILMIGWSLMNEILSKEFISAPNPKYGEECFNTAHEYVRGGDLATGLAYFRTAVRHWNISEQYWNDLGVTEMRLGEFFKARRRFIQSLDINPNYKAAQDNLRDISFYLKGEGHQLESHDYVLRRKQYLYRHEVRTVKEMTKTDFVRYFGGEEVSLTEGHFPRHSYLEPFVVRQYLDTDADADAFQIFSIPSLVSLYGDKRVDYYPQNMLEESSHPFFLSLSAAVDQLLAPKEVFSNVDVSNMGTYIQLNMDSSMWQHLTQLGSITIPAGLDDQKTWSTDCFSGSKELLTHFYIHHHWKMLLIGSEGAGMFAHQDLLRASSYQIQLYGSKRWHLCSDHETKNLYSPGDVDLFQPNYSKFPKVKRASCYETVVGPGDLIFYPGDYWHQTYNHDTPTIALSSTVITPRDFEEVAAVIEEQCQRVNDISVADDTSTNALDKHVRKLESDMCFRMTNQCRNHWKSIFSKRNNEEL